MSAIIFDGKAFGAGIMTRVRDRVKVLGKNLKVAAIYDSKNEASRIYTQIKAKRAREMGILFEAHNITDFEKAAEAIKVLNKDEEVTGIMIQLPLIDKQNDERLAQMIRREKDVDGLNPASEVIQATVRAVVSVVGEGIKVTGREGKWPLVMTIVGSKGTVGRGVFKYFKDDVRFKLFGAGRGEVRPEILDKSDILVSASGQQKMIGPEMVKPGAIVVDVGYPGGDVQESVAQKAGFLTPVPGGVGPVTVASLFLNLLELADKNNS